MRFTTYVQSVSRRLLTTIQPWLLPRESRCRHVGVVVRRPKYSLSSITNWFSMPRFASTQRRRPPPKVISRQFRSVSLESAGTGRMRCPCRKCVRAGSRFKSRRTIRRHLDEQHREDARLAQKATQESAGVEKHLEVSLTLIAHYPFN